MEEREPKSMKRIHEEERERREHEWARKPKNHAFTKGDGGLCWWCGLAEIEHKEKVDVSDGVRKVMPVK